MKKNYLIIATLFLISITELQAQKPLWSLPPNYFDFVGETITKLPDPGGQGPLYDNYSGQEALFSHNIMNDAAGNLLFFIVDGIIYDKNGYSLDAITPFIGEHPIPGTSEISIIPDPINSQRYYLISAAGAPLTSHEAGVVILDLSIPNLWSSDTNNPLQGDLVRDPITQYHKFINISAISPNFIRIGVKEGGLYIAASPVRSDNSRFVFISNSVGIYRYKIDAAGFNYDNYFIGHDGFSPTLHRAEMELIELSNGNYRIASFIGRESRGNAVFTAELNPNGVLIPGSKVELSFRGTRVSGNFERPYVYGLEFSPDGNILYISHFSYEPDYPNPIEYYDFNNPVLGVQSLVVTNAQDFEISQIEMGIDGKLYFATRDRLATLSNPNAPSSSNWNDTAQVISYPPNNMGLTIFPFPLTAYILPDQIDNIATTTIPPMGCDPNTPDAIVGTAGNNFLLGTPGDDVIVGLSGNDIIIGQGGNDCIYGGGGRDLIFTRGGDDEIFGGSGDDQIFSGGGADTVTGGAGNDRVFSGAGDDKISGGPGDDNLNGGGGIDKIDGGPGTDTCNGETVSQC